MGDRIADRSPMAWQGTLAQMKAHGTRLAQTASCECRGNWVEIDVDKLLAEHGPDWSAWDRRPPCARCGKPGHYMASPGTGSPFRPLRTGYRHDAERQAFLRTFGFSRRDIVRLRALAEMTSRRARPRPLNDLDAPYVVSACMPGQEHRHAGKVLGHWAGRTLLYTEMNEAERHVWDMRPKGPRPV